MKLNQTAQYNAPDDQAVPGLRVQSASEAVPAQPAQADLEEKPAREDLSTFFGIGMTINIIMIVAFVIWAIKQWKKHDTSEK